MPTAPLAHEWQHRLDHRDCSENVDVELTPHLFEWTLLKSPFVPYPALLTRTSIGPTSLSARATTRPMASKSVTSNTMARARAGSIAPNSCRAASLRTVPITEYPDESASVARARPKPEPAPVIRKFLFPLIAMSFLRHRSCAR